jgi:hypothetical protein
MNEQCFCEPGNMQMVDLVRPNGLSWINGESLEEIRAKYPRAELMDYKEAARQMDAATRKAYCTGPHEITAERFEEMLCVLPPEKWVNNGGSESFLLSELLIANIGSFYIRIGGKYYTVNDDIRTTHAMLLEMIAKMEAES